MGKLLELIQVIHLLSRDDQYRSLQSISDILDSDSDTPLHLAETDKITTDLIYLDLIFKQKGKISPDLFRQLFCRLLGKGFIPVHTPDKAGNTALHRLLLNLKKHEEIQAVSPLIELLIKEHKADVNAVNAEGMSPLVILATRPADSQRLMEMLIAHGAVIPERVSIRLQENNTVLETTLLHLAAQYSAGSGYVIQYLLEQGLSADAKDSDGRTPAQIANFRAKGPCLVAGFLRSKQTIVTTPLLDLISSIELQVTADSILRDIQHMSAKEFNTPIGEPHQHFLHWLLHTNHLYAGEKSKLFAKIFSSILDINIHTRNAEGHTLLHSICEKPELFTAEDLALMIERLKSTVNAIKIPRSTTPLTSNDLELTSLALQEPCNSPVEGTALHIAVQINNLELARCLLDKGAQVNAVSLEGLTPLELANDPQMKTLLLERGAATTRTTRNPVKALAEAMSTHNLPDIIALTAEITPKELDQALNKVTRKNDTGIFYLARGQEHLAAIILRLLSKGADPELMHIFLNEHSGSLESALVSLITLHKLLPNFSAVFNSLLRHGANPNNSTNTSNRGSYYNIDSAISPLMIAICYGLKPEDVRCLLDCGADPRYAIKKDVRINQNGRKIELLTGTTALALAIQLNTHGPEKAGPLVKLLQEYMPTSDTAVMLNSFETTAAAAAEPASPAASAASALYKIPAAAPAAAMPDDEDNDERYAWAREYK